MRSKVFNTILIFLLSFNVCAQYALSGYVRDKGSQAPITGAEVYNKTTNKILQTDSKGYFVFDNLKTGRYEIIIFTYQYQPVQRLVDLSASTSLNFEMDMMTAELGEVVIKQKREEVFGISRLNAVEGTSIFAGKKSEVILLDNIVGNLASNNTRQIYSQVVGLNIYEDCSAGLQLNVGGRGLDPNRTANFNTRQNGYDISADALGYPESYYAPPAEALEEIQVIRGAASLQYGPQFGGLINFKMKKPSTDKVIEVTSRQSIGSFNQFSSFNSLGGTKGKFSYYTYFNHKDGECFRDNSAYNANNFYAHLGYELSKKSSLVLQTTLLRSLAQQSGGLTDAQFALDPSFSNRTRNWFDVNWNLLALKYDHSFSSKSDLTISLSGVHASRKAVGFRGNPTATETFPVTDLDEEENGTFVHPRDLISGKFRNWSAETRYLTRYKINDQDAVFLIGAKYYQSNTPSEQGPGSNGSDANFTMANSAYPDYPNQSSFVNPNFNVSVFGEHIFNLSSKLALTPGVRYEYINTSSEGEYNQVISNNAGEPIANQRFTDTLSFARSIFLMGLGLSYTFNPDREFYVNMSQNYRPVTFSDIRTVSPSFVIDPEIQDETGYTLDFGLRGKWNQILSFDIGAFSLLYDNRIGIVLDDRARNVRKNIGQAWIYGLETFADWDIIRTFRLAEDYRLRLFMNSAITSSTYVSSEENGVSGNKVELIPLVNFKTGLNFGFRRLSGNLQFTHLSSQFSEASNAPAGGDGTVGEIPAYNIVDLSFAYNYGKFRIESGLNNLLNTSYFTRRATGYPGPGIIPSQPRSFYTTLQVKL